MKAMAALLAAMLAGQDPAELYRQAVELHQQGRLEQAAELYRKVLAAHPESVVARSNLGAALSAMGVIRRRSSTTARRWPGRRRMRACG